MYQPRLTIAMKDISVLLQLLLGDRELYQHERFRKASWPPMLLHYIDTLLLLVATLLITEIQQTTKRHTHKHTYAANNQQQLIIAHTP